MTTLSDSLFDLWESGILSRLILYFSGVLLIAIAFYGLIMDLIHNWKIEEYGSFVAFLTGAALMLSAYIVYYVIPEHQSRRRYAILREHYMSKPRGEIQNINHDIAERAQQIIAGSELLSGYVRSCAWEDLTYDECKSKVIEAKKMMKNVEKEYSRLQESINKLDEYVDSKRH